MAVTSPAATTTKMPRVTRAVIAASVAGGVVTLGVAGWRYSGLAQPSGIQWIVAAAMGALALASWLWPVVVYREGESEAFNTDDTFFVILALLVPPVLTLATLALAFVVAQAARRRLFVKSAFNTGQVLIAAGLGLASSRALAPPSASLSAAEVAALLLGVGVYFAVNSCLIAGVVISMGTTWREFTNDLPIQATLTGAGALAGVILALAIQAHPWAVALAVPALILQRRLISARFAALDEGTVRSHPGGQPGPAPGGRAGDDPQRRTAAAPQPRGHPDLRSTRPGPAGRADERGRPAAVAGRVGTAAR
jgi:hypothetical protein